MGSLTRRIRRNRVRCHVCGRKVAPGEIVEVKKDFRLSGFFLKACLSCAEDLEALTEEDIDAIFDTLEEGDTRGA